MNGQNPVNRQALRDAINTVLDYLWKAEQEDFIASTEAERTHHVFRAPLVLERWLRHDALDLTR